MDFAVMAGLVPATHEFQYGPAGRIPEDIVKVKRSGQFLMPMLEHKSALRKKRRITAAG
jgi:hypothetical protein